MSELEEIRLFATPIVSASLQGAHLREDLAGAIWMLEEGDIAGARWCEENGYDGYTSYASLNDLPERATAFAALKEELDRLANRFAAQLHWDMGAHALQLESMWVNILGEGGSHSGHIHPGSVISGTVYIDMPDGAGALKFEDPRLGFMQAAPALREDVPEALKRFVYRTPEAGTVLLWESWLRHEVMANRSPEPRLTISFNYALIARS